MAGFTAHIKDAIRINRERRQYYARVSKGDTRSLSNILIVLEIFVLPISRYYDLKATKFNNAGIGIVRNDFTPMILKPVELEPIYKNALTAAIAKIIIPEVKKYLALIRDMESLQSIKEVSVEFLNTINNSEQKFEIHLAMLGHLLESVIMISSNGINYSIQSKGKTENLTLKLLRLHFFGIKHALEIDRRANKFHQIGIGIIVNDLPEIK